jgi:hypothetical protein
MKRMYIILLAALGTVTTILSCKKELATVSSTVQKSDNPTSFTDFKPNYVYTLAGNPDKYNHSDGIANQAGFVNLAKLVADDGYLYALDLPCIRKIKIIDGTVTTLAGDSSGTQSRDGLKQEAGFLSPTSIALGPDGNIYVSEYFKVRKVTKEGKVTTIAGSKRGYKDGPAKTAQFIRLTSIAVCNDGTIYVIDDQSGGLDNKCKIRKISPTGVVSTLTSGPTGTASSSPWAISSLSYSNGTLYAAGTGIFKISSKGVVTTVKKDITVFDDSLLPLDDGSFFIARNNQVQRVSANGSVSVFAGIPVTDIHTRPTEGPADSVDLHTPSGFTLYNNILYIPVHPHLAALESQYSQQGHVIQMIAVPK